MSNDVDGYTLPISSSDLCFNGNAFIEPSFSADRFLQEHRGRASLETMRDDLGSYLKVLRSATLDLIDQEYADFVGLSSSLVGLDKAVGKIRDPLGQLREEVMNVKSSLEEAVRGIKAQLGARRNLRARRAKLESLHQGLKSLQRLESLLRSEVISKEGSDKAQESLPIAERAAAEFNHLQFCLGRCDAVKHLRMRTEAVFSQMMKLLETMLLENLKLNEEEQGDLRILLIRLLRTYASLGLCSAAEDLIGEHIVGPALDIAIKASHSKDAGRSGPANLSDIYNKVLSIVDEKLGKLLELTSDGPRPPPVKGFDFLSNSLWPQFVKKLEMHLPNINAPGNPDVFHLRFSETMEFLQLLERYYGSELAVNRFRCHPSYQPFLKLWNLPVYFQIRFQEIAGSLEATLPSLPYPTNGFDANSIEELMGLKGTHPTHQGFWILQTSTSWDCIIRCWDSKVFIPQLAHRFWKLNLQIVARYFEWSSEILRHQIKCVKDNISSFSGENGDDVGMTSEVGVASPQTQNLSAGLLLPVCLHRDASQLSKRLQETLLPRVMSLMHPLTNANPPKQDMKDLFKKSLNDAVKMLEDIEPMASKCVIRLISLGSLPHLRQCRDIPRFYRRTNRSHPTCPRPYVGASLAPPMNFRATILASFSTATKTSSAPQATFPSPLNQRESVPAERAWVDSHLLNHWMEKIFSEITVQFYADVSEVLTSVQKMEESLRKLKRIKGVGFRGQDGGMESSSTDDDDKIRAQLALDVHCFCEQVENTGAARGNVKQLPELVELVDNAMIKESNVKS